MKKRQTMGKMMRDRELRERRALKQQKKDERKLAAAEGDPEGGEGAVENGVVESGAVENGVVESGVVESGVVENTERLAEGTPSEPIPEPEARTT